MLKPIDPTAALRPQREPLAQQAINNVFKVLHGFYGNLFLSKFATGEVDEDDEDKGDKGTNSARMVWAHGLREFDGNTVKLALARCLQHHPEYPPSLPQFVALCSACKPREVYRPAVLVPALEMSPELREQRIREHREKADQLLRRMKDAPQESGLTLLKQAIADAVRAAGGDEVAELLRLDRMLAPRVSA
jgi:hypothetical protein